MRDYSAEEIANALKPARCPHCNHVLTYISYAQKRWMYYDVDLYYPEDGGKPYFDWITDEGGDEIGDPIFYCPHCKLDLTRSWDEALNIMRGLDVENNATNM